jgi:hypothetical protein
VAANILHCQLVCVHRNMLDKRSSCSVCVFKDCARIRTRPSSRMRKCQYAPLDPFYVNLNTLVGTSAKGTTDIYTEQADFCLSLYDFKLQENEDVRWRNHIDYHNESTIAILNSCTLLAFQYSDERERNTDIYCTCRYKSASKWYCTFPVGQMRS